MKKIILIFFFFQITPVIASSCLKIGVLGEFQSANSRASYAYGKEMRRGIEIAKKDLKHKCIETVEIDINNSISNIDGRIRKYSKEFGIKYFIGLGTSSQVHAAIQAVNQTNSILLSPTATDDSILSKTKNVFLISPTNKRMLIRILSELKILGLKKASVLYGANDIYSKSMADGFKKESVNFGVEVVYMKEIRTGRNSKLDSIEVSELNSSDVLFLPVYELDVLRILGHLYKLGFKKKIVGTDSWGSNSKILQAISKDVRNQILFSTTAYLPSNKDIRGKSFFKNYVEAFSTEPMDMSSFSYESLKIVSMIQEKCSDNKIIDLCLKNMGKLESTTGHMEFTELYRSFDRDVFLRRYE
jgi:branched-chain amino acid transport system substrate-binding protein